MISTLEINYTVAAIGGLVVVSYFLFVVWLAVDAIRGGKLLWCIAILGVPIIGAVVYFFVEKQHDYMKLREEERPR